MKYLTDVFCLNKKNNSAPTTHPFHKVPSLSSLYSGKEAEYMSAK